jgi:hypothetical protein
LWNTKVFCSEDIVIHSVIQFFKCVFIIEKVLPLSCPSKFFTFSSKKA